MINDRGKEGRELVVFGAGGDRHQIRRVESLAQRWLVFKHEGDNGGLDKFNGLVKRLGVAQQRGRSWKEKPDAIRVPPFGSLAKSFEGGRGIRVGKEQQDTLDMAASGGSANGERIAVAGIRRGNKKPDAFEVPIGRGPAKGQGFVVAGIGKRKKNL